MTAGRGSEVIVVGAGIAGACAAMRLAELGHEVIVFDREGVAAEASGVNGGLVGGSTHQGVDGQLTLGSLDLFTELQQERGYAIGLRRCGGLQVVHNETQWDFMQSAVTRQQENGHQVELLSRREARVLEPALAGDIAGCVYRPQQGQAEPELATRAFASEAARLGAAFAAGVEVVSLEGHANGFTLGTGQGDWRCDTLVLAAGAWLDPLAQKLGVKLPVVPVMGQMWATAPGRTPALQHVFSSAESTLAWHGDANVGQDPAPDLTHYGGVRITRHLYGRQTLNGEVVFGGDRCAQGWDKTRAVAGIAVNKAHATGILPFLGKCATVRTWSGLMPFTPDGAAIIGRVADGLFACGGLASSGFTRGPMAGRFVADLIDGRDTPDGLAALSPTRFS